MEKQDRNEKMLFTVQDKAYFCSDSHINLQSTDEKELMAKVIQSILNKIITYQKMEVVGILKKFFILRFILLFIIQ